MSRELVLARPLAGLVGAFGTCKADNEAHRRLTWLSMFVARRALPCWELYCDGQEPHSAVAAVEAWLASTEKTSDVAAYAQPASPGFRGRAIVDCRVSDTSCAARAAAYSARLIGSADPFHAIFAISAADAAFDQSPLQQGDNFRTWLIDYAIPIAYAQREMSATERNALREYSVGEIAFAREQQTP